MAIAIIPLAYVASFVLLSFYTGGDQTHYHKFYKALHGVGIDKIAYLASFHLASAEPLSAAILWVGANLGIEKNIYISLLNVIMIVGIFVLARRNQVSLFVIGLLLTNFYVVVLMTGAERLKIAYIFLILGALSIGKKSLILFVGSILSHLQNGLLLAGVVAGSFSRMVSTLVLHFSVSRRSIWLLIASASIGSAIGYLIFDGIARKVADYAVIEFSPSQVVKVGILSAIALYVSNKRLRMILTIFPTIIAIAFLGDIRVNMIAVTLVIYNLMDEHRLDHPLVHLLLVYFSLKSIPFIYNIVLYGNGFEN